MADIEKIKISTPFIKLDSLLKFVGLAATGGEAKFHITEEAVKVNKQICVMRGKKIYPGDIVELDGACVEVVSDEA